MENGDHDERPYGFMERELAFKLLASHAMVDAEFYEALKADPAGAAEQLHIALTEEDVSYIQNDVDWKSLDQWAGSVRESLNLERVTSSW
jgi:hypothetical protein